MKEEYKRGKILKSQEGYLTIVTPTYNRANLISNLYISLCKQTVLKFQWLIIDDGSTDNTDSIVLGFDTDRFEICYCKKENGGKHTAINVSHPYIKGEYVVIVDSDDTLTQDAVETILTYWSKYHGRKEIGGICFLKGYSLKRAMTKYFPDEEIVTNFIDYRINRGIRGDCCETVRSELFCKFLFPVFTGERYVPEGNLWQRIAEISNMVFINKIIYIADYLDDGLTKSGRFLRISNPNGMAFDAKTCLECKKVCIRIRMKSATLFVAYNFFARNKIRYILQATTCKLLVCFALPGGLALYLYWKKKYLH